jgi:hypothetical protein
VFGNILRRCPSQPHPWSIVVIDGGCRLIIKVAVSEKHTSSAKEIFP